MTPQKAPPLKKRPPESPRNRRNCHNRPDPGDNFLLGLAEAGNADYLVTGQKSGLLSLASHKSTRIITARDFASLLAADAP
jgi:predicted nucleic acid-binding protein